MKCAFITPGYTRGYTETLKHLLMRLRGVVYPDVYSIPYWLGARVTYVSCRCTIKHEEYNFVFSELNAGLDQLGCLKDLLEVAPRKVVILPGPPEIFESYASKEGRDLATCILRKAAHVWAYSSEVAKFANEIADDGVARVIPWPFNYSEVRRLGRTGRNSREDDIRVLMGVPLRFLGIAENAPHFLEECLARCLEELAPVERKRFRFYGIVYTNEDRVAWQNNGLAKRIGAILEPRKSYIRFLRFMDKCDAVITLPRFSVLGRIAFMAAALEKPGIFTENVELNRRLYPGSLVRSPTDEKLLELVRDLLYGLLEVKPVQRFMPDMDATKEVGDFAQNGLLVRELLNTPAAR